MKSIGVLYYVSAILGVVSAVGFLLESTREPLERWGGPILMVCLTAILVITGGWLRRLDRRGRVPSTLLAVVGLLSFPVGTLINGYILYLLHSAKGRYVFTPEYQQVIAATPEIRYQTSKVVLILGGIVIVFLVLGVILAFSKGR